MQAVPVPESKSYEIVYVLIEHNFAKLNFVDNIWGEIRDNIR